ncbi:MAG TPA: hypothetical protein VHD58_00925 [Mycobacteriales bacterium]|nr:hypothetical protein [Mycobacteriales bacterium]
MVLEPVLLLNDGGHLSLARVTDAGTVEVAALPYELPVEHPAYGRFLDVEGLVIDQHPSGVRLSPTAAEPALPSLPGTNRRGAQMLRDGRGVALGDDHLWLYDGSEWTRHDAPEGVRPQSAAFLERWWAGGERGRRPILFDPVTGAEEAVPWKRRLSWHVSDGTFARVEVARSGLVVNQDDGILERSVSYVYLNRGGGWSSVYVGDDLTSRVSDPNGDLPPVLLNSGRWIVPTAGDKARILEAPQVGEKLRKRAGQRSVVWGWVGAISGHVTALVSLWPSGERVVLRGPVGGELEPARRWASEDARPVSATLADTTGFEWTSG